MGGKAHDLSRRWHQQAPWFRPGVRAADPSSSPGPTLVGRVVADAALARVPCLLVMSRGRGSGRAHTGWVLLRRSGAGPVLGATEHCGGPSVGPCPMGRQAGLSPGLQMGPAPARSLVTRSWRSGTGAAGCWVVGLGVALLKAAGHRPWGLEGGATCTPTFLPLFPRCFLACRASLIAAPPRGVLSRIQMPTPFG